ncbi:MAG TPA: tetratricopeptide repeat protein [Terriglobales bacterium]|nr:tetratricopeptide repeat protein [Terriglobales bacterium]
MDDSKSLPDQKSAAKKRPQRGVGTPFAGESSGSNIPVPPQDEATLVDAFPKAIDPEATLVDADATIAPGASFRLTPTPASNRISKFAKPLPQDEATLVDAFPKAIDPEATLVDADATIALGTPFRRTPPPPPNRISDSYASAAVLQIGAVLGGRYEILQLLGEGGMGAVYKAADRELDRFVALKVIRPELASNPSILARFKQELLLAHQVTHRNVIRIYDLGEAEGVKFITMEFIEGQDLRALIREKKRFTPEEAVDVIQQVCQALNAAHSVGVIHRDLKPQNIMQDGSGRILVMDFGLARTLEGDGMTQTGALVGTMEYMSPEQALAKDLDQRSDIFALGLILYEMLTGKQPFSAESALASLIKRTQERATPVSDVDAQIPGALSGIVSKCLERDLDQRYQNVSAILADLNTWQDKRAAGTIKLDAAVKPWGQTLPWPRIAGIVTALVLAISGYMLRDRLFRSPPSTGPAPGPPAVSLAILPFRNASGDQALDWLGPSLADMLSTDVGQSAQLRTVSPTSLHQVFTDLRLSSATVLDPATIRRVADFSNANRVVWGQYAKFGDQIRIDATLQDIKNDRTVPLKIDVPSEKEIPGAIDRLAESIRQKLALPEDVLKELKASSFQPSSKSIAALRDYDRGIGLQRDGKNLEAQKQFEAASKEDPTFALAFSKLAQAYSSLGYDSEAEQYAKKAVELSQDLPESEKYLISAIRYEATKNYSEAIKAYEALAKASPDNSDVQSALAGLYRDSGDLVKARAYYQKLLSSNPKDVAATLNLGRIDIKSGDSQGSFDPLNRAYSLAVQVDNQEQKATSLHLMAVAYMNLSKPEEALRNEQEAITIWRHIGQKRGLAFSLNVIASTQASLGKTKDALSNFKEALQIRREIGDRRGLGDTLLDLGNFYNDAGDHDQALKMYKEALQLEREIGDESMQAICQNNIGNVYLEKGQYDDALTYFQQTLQLREKSKTPQDIVDAVHNLGEVLADMGQYDQAISYYMRALDLWRGMNDPRGAAKESYSLGTLFDYQGRFGAAVNSKQDALKTFRDLKDRTFWMAEMLGGSAEALILAGRGDEVKSSLEEALALSRELKNDGMVSQTLGFQGDAFFYRGDFKSARASYAQALQAATLSKEPDKVLIASTNLAKVLVQEKRTQEAFSGLRPLIQQADDLGRKYISVECSIIMAETLFQRRDYSGAQEELKRALLRSDKLGMQPLSARAHYLLAIIERDSGNSSEAQDNYREALRLLDAMKKDPGAEKLLQRADFKAIYEESARGTQAAKS